MGRRIMKNLIIIFAKGLAISRLIIVISACSVDMLDYIGDKIEIDENIAMLNLISYRDMVSITGGTYTQTDGTQSFSHTVSDFKLGQYEVTYELWYTVHDWALSNGYTFANPGIEGNDGTLTDPAGAAPTAAKYEPVTTINWRDAIVWCNAYSEMSGYSPVYYIDIAYTAPLKTSTNNGTVNTTAGSEDNPYVNWSANGYRLPTEGEWQYAASNKGGTTYNHASGAYTFYNDTEDTNPNNSVVDGKDANDEVAVYGYYWDGSWVSTGVNKTADVGTKTDNELVIYDMSGNVWEWCWDWWDNYPVGPETGYTGATSGSFRLGRGGGWDSNAVYMRVCNRYSLNPYYEDHFIGFRLACGQ